MKIFFIVTTILFSLFFIISVTWAMLWFGWIYPKNYEYALELANDASLPQVKADYLNEYLEKVKTITGEPRYIFKRPDLDLDKQIVILEGLISRFEEIAKIPQSEMAYQQGMYQLSGQEIDHQLDKISGVFMSARLRENFGQYFMVSLGWFVFMILGAITGCFWDGYNY